MSDLEQARQLLLRSVDHLKWARDTRAKAWQKEREENLKVIDFYKDVTDFLKTTSPAPTE